MYAIIATSLFLGSWIVTFGCCLALRPLRRSPLMESRFKPHHEWCLTGLRVAMVPAYLVAFSLAVVFLTVEGVLFAFMLALLTFLIHTSDMVERARNNTLRHKLVALAECGDHVTSSDALVALILYHVDEWPYRPIDVQLDCTAYAQGVKVRDIRFVLDGENELYRTMFLLAANGKPGPASQVPVRLTIQGSHDRLPGIKLQMGTPEYQ